MFDDYLSEQLRHLLQSQQWKSFEALHKEVVDELKNERTSRLGDTADEILYKSISRDAKIEGMSLLIRRAQQRAGKE